LKNCFNGKASNLAKPLACGSELPHAKGFAELGGFGENNSSNTSIGLFGGRESIRDSEDGLTSPHCVQATASKGTRPREFPKSLILLLLLTELALTLFAGYL
jgi:hypothetical protein